MLKERGMTDRGKVLEHVKTEVQRRLHLDDMITSNTEYAKKNYTPLYPQIRSYKVLVALEDGEGGRDYNFFER